MTAIADPIPLQWITMDDLAALRATGKPLVALVAIGSVEPHGPHLPLGTDDIISHEVQLRAARALGPEVTALIAPAVHYGVTEFAFEDPDGYLITFAERD